MSIESTVSESLVAQHFRGEWTISNLGSLKSSSVRTVAFRPMDNINIAFCFEVHYNKLYNLNCSNHELVSVFKLKLLTLSASGLPSTLKLELKVNLVYIDGTPLNEYKFLPALTADEMKLIEFEDLVWNKYKHSSYSSSDRMAKEDSLILKCRMKFFDHIQTPPTYHKEVRSLEHFKKFAKNFNSIHKFGELSDFTFVINEKSLPAHKAVLAAHSPVFKNMMIRDFKESISNTTTITDFSFEIFECFLKYLYSGEIEDESWPTVKELYTLADKYDISSLKHVSCDIIISQISLERVCDILNLAFDYDDEKIKKRAVGFAAAHIRELIPTKEWKELISKYPLAGYEAAISYVL